MISNNPHLPLGSSPCIVRVRELLQQVSAYMTNVLITGESGTGKEWAALYLHSLSLRSGKAFVPINCGAIPPDLLESELFGHEQGAFTGALTKRVGRFEAAEGGTILLDEIGDMSLTMQVKLLRVIQERVFERIGSNRSRSCNVRLIAATHRNLEEAIGSGTFREDLFYRLNVFPIALPPLRDRIEDLDELIVALLEHNRSGGMTPVRLTQNALHTLEEYSWPGNIREVANLMERLCVLYPGGRVDVQDLPGRYRGVDPESDWAATPAERECRVTRAPPFPASGQTSLKHYLETLEASLIRDALGEAGGVVARAARSLRLNRTTLAEKMRRYEIASVGPETGEAAPGVEAA